MNRLCRPGARVLVALLLSACSKEESGNTTGGPAVSAGAAAPTTARAEASAPGAAPSNQPAKASGAATYQGKYKSDVASPYVDPEAPKGARWVPDTETAGKGEGDLSIAVAEDGTASGTVSGPLGPAVLSGRSQDGVVLATVRRKAPNDQGLTGSLSVTLADGKGTMRLSSPDARIVREAAVTLQK